MSNKLGIVLQGPISEWTSDIIEEHKVNFPDCDIVLSTWDNEDVSSFSCKIVKTKQPKISLPYNSNINFQIIGAREGLKKINADIIMKCRTDQFVHNPKIFSIYNQYCTSEKIMVPDHGTSRSEEYRLSDICQIGTKKILNDYWNLMPLFDGSYPITPETYLTKNYVLNVKKDTRRWDITRKNYFCIRGFDEDFKIEWIKPIHSSHYRQKYRTDSKDWINFLD